MNAVTGGRITSLGSYMLHANKKTKKDVRFHDQRCDMPSGMAFSETERWYNY
jgi:hypothetical protein